MDKLYQCQCSQYFNIFVLEMTLVNEFGNPVLITVVCLTVFSFYQCVTFNGDIDFFNFLFTSPQLLIKTVLQFHEISFRAILSITLCLLIHYCAYFWFSFWTFTLYWLYWFQDMNSSAAKKGENMKLIKAYLIHKI